MSKQTIFKKKEANYMKEAKSKICNTPFHIRQKKNKTKHKKQKTNKKQTKTNKQTNKPTETNTCVTFGVAEDITNILFCYLIKCVNI